MNDYTFWVLGILLISAIANVGLCVALQDANSRADSEATTRKWWEKEDSKTSAKLDDQHALNHKMRNQIKAIRKASK